MTSKNELQNALKEAIRKNDSIRKGTLRMALTSIRMAEDRKRDELDDDEVIGVLQKEIKSRQETVEDAQKANRPELAEEARAQIVILEEFLPKQMTQEELEELARQAIEQVGAESPREMGQVMKVLVPLLKGRATGQEASQVVRRLLQ
ncbi:MAG: GatB/YqeY domain-containing protein [Anaerolineales bacterium]|jgi:uncharacterized protein YqeY